MTEQFIPVNATQERRTRRWRAAAAILGLALLASIAATQYLAAAFAFHPALSGRIAGQFHWPWSWAVWSFTWGSLHADVIQQGVAIFTTGTALPLLLWAAHRLQQHRRLSALASLHGTAHWASRQEILDSGLLPRPETPSQGVYVGAWFDEKNRRTRYLRHNGPEHVLAFAPTRSGKGVGLVIPTLLSWPHSVVCYDIKGENWALTAGWRQQYAGNTVLKFDPAAQDGSCARFNPLAEIRLGEDREVGDAQNIATMLVDPDGKGLADHWAKTSQALLTGAVLHCCYVQRQETGHAATLADVDELLAHPEMDIQAVLERMLEYPHLGGGLHPVVARAARTLLNLSGKELSSVVSTALSFLSLYRDPVVAGNTGRSDFRIRDLMHHAGPVSLYLVVRPADADRLRPLVRLVITQIVRRSTERMRFENGKSMADYRHRLLLLIDEFASLKRLPVIEEALAFMAGYGLKAYLIVQDLQQIHSAYGRDEGLIGNCHLRIAYAPNKLETAELLSRMAGQTTVVRKQVTISGLRAGGGSRGQRSESMQEIQRPLITADEVMRLPSARKDAHGNVLEPGCLLVFAAGQAPIHGRQILYFRDPVFQQRARIRAPETSDRIDAGDS